MERVCFLLRVRPDRMEEYKRRHACVWPEMLEALRDAGWHNYSLFLGVNGLLVGYLETNNFQLAMEGLARQEVNSRWQTDMSPFFESGSRPGEAFVMLEQVFHTD